MAAHDDAEQQTLAAAEENTDRNKEESRDIEPEREDENDQQHVSEENDYESENRLIHSKSVSNKELSIDLSKFEPKYNTRSISALPNVLVDYGLPQQERKKTRSRATKISNERKKARKEEVFMPDIDLERLRIKEEHQMEVYEDVHKLRDYYYEEYMDALRDKIRKQKDDIQKKSNAMESRFRKNELLKKEQSHRLKRRMVPNNINHDETFLKGIPKSQFYRIVSLHDKWKSEGKLKTQTDVDAFWRNIRRPEVYKKHFGSESGDSVTTLMSSQQHGLTASTSSYQSTGQPLDNLGPRQLTQITESKETSRPTTREISWMTTHQSKSLVKPPADPYVIAKQAAMSLDRKCPQVPLPPMSCFTMELGEKPPDPNVLREQAEHIARKKKKVPTATLR